MGLINEDRDRQVVPRWRSANAALRQNELVPLKVREVSQFNEESVHDLVREWKQTKSITIASELVSVCLALDLTETATDAAEFVVASPNAMPLARDIALKYLKNPQEFDSEYDQGLLLDATDIYPKIALLKRQLAFYPKNPLQWANLARLYVMLGQAEKASRAMEVALALAPLDRFVLRAAARMLLHQGDGKKAHQLLRESPLVRVDPWIMSAEIAVASAIKRPSVNVKQGLKIIEAEKFDEKHISELASAIGTLEVRNGNRKKGKRLLIQSLNKASENALAQAGWLVKSAHIPNEFFPQEEVVTPSHEANAWFSMVSKNWSQTVIEAKAWQSDQPFSSRPAMLGSFVSSSLGKNFNEGAAFARRGLLSNPDDITLYNNLAFALIHLGEKEESRELIDRALQLEGEARGNVALRATDGLWHYHFGNHATGRTLYKEAIEMAKHGDKNQYVTAKIMLADAESKVGTEEADALRAEAKECLNDATDPTVAVIAARLDVYEAST